MPNDGEGQPGDGLVEQASRDPGKRDGSRVERVELLFRRLDVVLVAGVSARQQCARERPAEEHVAQSRGGKGVFERIPTAELRVMT